MLTHAKLVAFAATGDAARSKTFYRDVLGLKLISEDGFAIVFDAHGTTLRISMVKDVVTAPYTVLGWEVPDMAEAVQGLASRGVVFERFAGLPQDKLGIWKSPDGGSVAWFKDPSGNLLSVSSH